MDQTNDAESDLELWTASQAGDGRAFGRLYSRHEPRVAKYAWRLVGFGPDADDAIAVVFLELWRRRKAVQTTNGSVLPWLLNTTHNVARNLQRSRKRYEKFLVDLPPAAVAPSAEDVAVEESARTAEHVRLTELLGTLSVKDAQILSLAVVAELPMPETAAALGLSEAAARQRLSRARQRARSILTDSQQMRASLANTIGGD